MEGTEPPVFSYIKRHNQKHQEKQRKTQVDDKVMIKGDEKNKGKWETAVAHELFSEEKDVVSTVQSQKEASFNLLICLTSKENAFQGAILYTMTSR